ncbi:MAG: hydrogenase maturation protease [Candidatus Nanopelagicales bacterium]|nr:hydrogenase maturation protease [Candidatus Nanopelagicales bacterium]
MSPVLVIGVGNPYRRDDGVGLAILERLRSQPLDGVEIVEETGEPTALVTRWAGYSFAIMIDAVSSGAPPGTVHRIECSDGNWAVPARNSKASTHGLGVAEAVQLGLALNRIPDRLTILGVETKDVANGEGLSPEVAAAVDDVVAAVIAEAEAVLTPN